MAGIYLHIPFCKSRCIYCDFYTTTELSNRSNYVETLIEEIRQRKDYLDTPIQTIYFGGGTPSLLSFQQLDELFDILSAEFDLNDVKEITIEANPDDLSRDYLVELQKTPVNRLSVGIQSFDNNQLKSLNRRHSAQQAIDAIKMSQDCGFTNISIDLIYGLPTETIADWDRDISQAISLDIQHISAYHLIYEEGTPLFRSLKEGKISEVEEDLSVQFFDRLINKLAEAGFEHYEISNFCKKGFRSMHNSSYWNGAHYLGCGPSAHSFNGESREWNVSSLVEYMEGINSGHRLFEKETLDITTQYNDYIITSLRRYEGVDLKYVNKFFGDKLYQHCVNSAKQHLNSHTLSLKNNNLVLTRKGLFVSDGIMSDLLFIL